MEKYTDFIVDVKDVPIFEIEYSFHRFISINSIEYLHYVGHIIREINVLPRNLSDLLKEKTELINEGMFYIPDLDSKINNYNLRLMNRKVSIINLYIEELELDFCIINR